MADGAGHPSASELVEVTRRDLADVEREIRSHRFFAALDDGRVPRERLGEFAGEQYAILSSDRRSFAALAARFSQPPPGDLFLALAAGEGQALGHLVAFASALGLDEEALRAHEPDPRAQAYPAFVAWLALNGSPSDLALALVANLAAWGANCAHMRRASLASCGEQYAIRSSDRRSFAALAARFPQPPPGDLFLALAAGEGQALGHLVEFAGALGLDEDALRAHEPDPRAQAYPAFVAWLALNGSPSDLALALVANLAAWGANCAHMAQALRDRYELDDQAVVFFDFFAQPPADFEQRTLAVLDAGLRAGDSPPRALRAARLLQAYELLFWDALAEGIT